MRFENRMIKERNGRICVVLGLDGDYNGLKRLIKAQFQKQVQVTKPTRPGKERPVGGESQKMRECASVGLDWYYSFLLRSSISRLIFAFPSSSALSLCSSSLRLPLDFVSAELHGEKYCPISPSLDLDFSSNRLIRAIKWWNLTGNAYYKRFLTLFADFNSRRCSISILFWLWCCSWSAPVPTSRCSSLMFWIAKLG